MSTSLSSSKSLSSSGEDPSTITDADNHNYSHTTTAEEEQARGSVLGPSMKHPYHDRFEEISNEDQDGGGKSGAAAVPVASSPSDSAFPLKLYDMLSTMEQDGLTDVCGWQPHGRCFVVRDTHRFTKEILSRCFSQTKFTSFLRQLNLYGFKRLSNPRDRGGYYHQCFLRGRRSLCHQIKRNTSKGEGPRKRSNPDDEPNFWEMPICREQTGTLPPRSSQEEAGAPLVSYAEARTQTDEQSNIATDATYGTNRQITNGRLSNTNTSAGSDNHGISYDYDYSAPLSVTYNSAAAEPERTADLVNHVGDGASNRDHSYDYTVPLTLAYYNAVADLPFRSSTTSNIASVTSSQGNPGISSVLRTVPANSAGAVEATTTADNNSSSTLLINAQQHGKQEEQRRGHGIFGAVGFERDLQTASGVVSNQNNGAGLGYDELMGVINDRHTGTTNVAEDMMPLPCPDPNQDAVLDALQAVAPYYNLSQQQQQQPYQRRM